MSSKKSNVWDSKNKIMTLSQLFRENKYFVSEEIIDELAKQGIEKGKLPEHFVLDKSAEAVLVEVIDTMIDDMVGLDRIVDSIVGFLKGYSEGIREATTDTNVKEL